MTAPMLDGDQPPDPPEHRDFSIISTLHPCHPQHKASLNENEQTSIDKIESHNAPRVSATWTTSSIDLGSSLDEDEIDGRASFIHAYNRLAKKASSRLFCPASGLNHTPTVNHNIQNYGWFSKLFRNVSGYSRGESRNEKVRHKRSVSDIALTLIHSRRDTPKNVELHELIRLTGKSLLRLPRGHAPAELIVPTCIRATAHYLTQNGVNVKGVFRIPGSVRVVNALYTYYCYADKDGDRISGTIRSVSLPGHLRFTVHDVASTFKRFISVLPGGILGSLEVFDAFVAIHSQLRYNPEAGKLKHRNVRARLIALAIGTVQSHYRRELICAVFGLLSYLGRTAEIAKKKAGDGNSLLGPGLMGYSALGIVIGPLLVGDLLSSYSTKMADPSCGLVLSPATPPMSRREKLRKNAKTQNQALPLTVDKIWVANEVATMIIANWKDAVEHISMLEALRPDRKTFRSRQASRHASYRLHLSKSEPLISTDPGPMHSKDSAGRADPPQFDTPTQAPRFRVGLHPNESRNSVSGKLRVRKLRPGRAASSSLSIFESSSPMEVMENCSFDSGVHLRSPFITGKENGGPGDISGMHDRGQPSIRSVPGVGLEPFVLTKAFGKINGNNQSITAGRMRESVTEQRMTDGASESVDADLSDASCSADIDLVQEPTRRRVSRPGDDDSLPTKRRPSEGGEGLTAPDYHHERDNNQKSKHPGYTFDGKADRCQDAIRDGSFVKVDHASSYTTHTPKNPSILRNGRSIEVL
ncbi:hypothetical protein jhhlp_005872 [Lomentospora prolificans]|uniref:Rho-GAP domain-containing protein n=1 Tax=Lomentospora prolificans TaxID=41688 RepID=A0A2N3N4A7_9PEZI|nr:hypothetical protein jhhlp_005872 [Lomentospora prolificans]